MKPGQTSPFALNYDYGTHTAGASARAGRGGLSEVSAERVVRRDAALRVLQGPDGFSTGTAQNLQEFTLTFEFKHKGRLLDPRVDNAAARHVQHAAFPLAQSNATAPLTEMVKNQNALTIGWVYAFSSKTP